MAAQGENFRFGLRPTLTNAFVENFPEIIEFFNQEFPNIGISVEPVSECGRCTNSNFYTPNPYVFAKKYAEVQDKFPGIELDYSGFGGIHKIRQVFCGAIEPSFSIMPSGAVTSCYGYPLKDICLQHFIYGYFDNNKQSFIIDKEKIKYLRKLVFGLNKSECSNCFAKYTCGGDCPALKIAQNKGVTFVTSAKRCIINREITMWHLTKEVQNYEKGKNK